MKTKSRPNRRLVREDARPTSSRSPEAVLPSTRGNDFLALCCYPGMKPAATRPSLASTAA